MKLQTSGWRGLTKRSGVIIAGILFIVCALLRTQAGATVGTQAFGNLPLHFEPSRPTKHSDAAFVAVAGGQALRIDRTSIRAASPARAGAPGGSARNGFAMVFEGADATASIEGVGLLEGRSHYFPSPDAGQAVVDVPHFATVRVAGLYRGIDLIYHARDRDLEYDLVLAPGADPGSIRLRFAGVDSIALDRAGDLVARAGTERIRQHRPVIYQDVEGRRVQVSGRYVPLGAKRFGVHVGRFDRTRALVIDPVLAYSTALGGKASDAATAIAIDAAGNAYVAGWTSSSNFPVVNPYDSHLGGVKDVFVAKLNATGTALIYSTFIGGSKGQEFATGIAIDLQGNAYVTGTTDGSDYPVTTGAYRTAPSTGGGAFVSKLGAAGNTLVYSTYVPFATATRIAVDAAGSAYVGGQAASGFATTAGAFQTTIRTQSGGAPFVLKLNAGGTAALYATIVGGSLTDTFKGMALDDSGSVYVAGATDSPDFPMLNPMQSTLQGRADGFVTKLNATGSAPVFSTYLGGTLDDSVNAIAVDAAGSAYVTGVTYSSNFPLRNAFQPVKAGSHLVNSSLGNAFVAKLTPPGNALVYASFLGGEVCYPGYCQSVFGAAQIPGDAAYGIAVDGQGHALVTGVAKSYTFPLIDSRVGQKQQDNEESLFVVKVSVSGEALLYSSLMHTGYDAYGPTVTGIPSGAGQAIAVDNAGNAYLALQDLGDFPTTPGAFQSTAVGGHSFVFKLSSGNVQLALSSSENPSLGGGPLTISALVTGADRAGTIGFMDGRAVVGSAPVTGGVASLSLTLPVGIRRLSAIYRDGTSESDSPALYQVVNPRSTCP